MTTSELRNKLNATCDLQVDDFTVRVRCLDSRVSYGRIHYKVTPINGTGTKWIDGQRTSNWAVDEYVPRYSVEGWPPQVEIRPTLRREN